MATFRSLGFPFVVLLLSMVLLAVVAALSLTMVVKDDHERLLNLEDRVDCLVMEGANECDKTASQQNREQQRRP